MPPEGGRRPVTVIVFGLVAFDDLAVDLLPEISYPSLTVRTEYEGAAPSEVESLITRPVENAVGVVPGVTSVRSSSRADIGEVILEFGWGLTWMSPPWTCGSGSTWSGSPTTPCVRSCCATTRPSTRSCESV